MKKINLKNGGFTMVDNDDYDELIKYNWRAYKNRNKMYVRMTPRMKIDGKKKDVYMARFIKKDPKGMIVDHINGDTLDNRKKNLRICTIQENSRNRGMSKNNKTGYKGVYWHGYEKRYNAVIVFNKKSIYLGSSKNKEDAYKIYCAGCIKYHGDFHHL